MLDIETLIKRISQDISSVLRVSMPARVVNYDYKSQKVDVKLDLKELYSDGREVDYPIVSGVPVIFPISGGASITMPIVTGDSCFVIFADRDLTNWLLGAKSGRLDSRRTHDINDAVAIMGLRQFTDVSAAENNDDLLISYAGSKVRLRPNGNVDIISTTSVTVETGEVTINCNNSTINAKSDVNINCNDAIVKAVDKVDVECINANIKAASAVAIDCENSSVVASNNINLECKNGYIQASENINILSDGVNIKTNADINLQCVNANITASETITFISNNTNITATENISVNCKSATIAATDTITATAKTINSTSETFTHTGNLSITGDLVVSGSTELGGVTFSTHTHSYNEPVVGSEPTAAIPSVTGGVT
jgi:hypothetical protein